MVKYLFLIIYFNSGSGIKIADTHESILNTKGKCVALMASHKTAISNSKKKVYSAQMSCTPIFNTPSDVLDSSNTSHFDSVSTK